VNIQPTSDATSAAAQREDCDLAEEARLLRSAESFSVQGHRAKTLTRNGDLTIVMMAMRHGTHVRDHRAEHPTTIVVLRGRMRVGLEAQTLELGAQHLLSLDGGSVYDMEAIEDSDMLLVVGR
jgi:quercetin dioxygenase-like cupin family protein